jgi:hypothetical protein
MSVQAVNLKNYGIQLCVMNVMMMMMIIVIVIVIGLKFKIIFVLF